MYNLLIAIIYLAFISLGLPDSLLGAAWPIIHTEIGVPISYLGIISMIISGGTIVSSLLSEKVTRKFGTRAVTTFSIFLSAVALLGFSYSDKLWMMILFSIPYGLGAGAIDAALNNYVALHYSSRHMSWLHCFWGVGTIISPFVMSYALANSIWNDGYRIISIIQFSILLIIILSGSAWHINSSNESNVSNNNTDNIGIIGAVKIKGVPGLLVGFFAYCAAEATAMSWSCTYLVEVKNMDEATAAALASCFFIGMTVGRFLGGFIMNKLGDKKMIWLGTLIGACGILLILIPSNNDTLAIIGLIVFGLGCAPIYPCIIHSTPNNFGADKSATIIGIQMASAYLGTTLMSPLFGAIAKIIGFEFFPIYLLIFFILMIIMINQTFNTTQNNK